MSDLEDKLIDAARSGDIEGVQAALATGADVHAEMDSALFFFRLGWASADRGLSA